MNGKYKEYRLEKIRIIKTSKSFFFVEGVEKECLGEDVVITRDSEGMTGKREAMIGVRVE